MKLFVFHAGGDFAPRGFYDPLDDDPTEIVYGPYLFFLVEHPQGRVLFDTGLHPKWRDAESTGALRIEVSAALGVVEQLATIGVSPSDVQHVVQSHLHFDHAGGLQHFVHANIYVQERELRFAYWPAVYQRDLYDRDDFDRDHKWVELDGSHDVFGDGALRIIPTPGHTPGHQSLIVELASGPVVLAADVSYLSTKMRERRLAGVVWSPDETVATWRKLEGLERTTGATLLFTHDLDFRESKKLAPEAWYE
jgi:N-acyl homoserine lactone hydrolase